MWTVAAGAGEGTCRHLCRVVDRYHGNAWLLGTVCDESGHGGLLPLQGSERARLLRCSERHGRVGQRWDGEGSKPSAATTLCLPRAGRSRGSVLFVNAPTLYLPRTKS